MILVPTLRLLLLLPEVLVDYDGYYGLGPAAAETFPLVKCSVDAQVEAKRKRDHSKQNNYYSHHPSSALFVETLHNTCIAPLLFQIIELHCDIQHISNNNKATTVTIN